MQDLAHGPSDESLTDLNSLRYAPTLVIQSFSAPEGAQSPDGVSRMNCYVPWDGEAKVVRWTDCGVSIHSVMTSNPRGMLNIDPPRDRTHIFPHGSIIGYYPQGIAGPGYHPIDKGHMPACIHSRNGTSSLYIRNGVEYGPYPYHPLFPVQTQPPQSQSPSERSNPSEPLLAPVYVSASAWNNTLNADTVDLQDYSETQRDFLAPVPWHPSFSGTQSLTQWLPQPADPRDTPSNSLFPSQHPQRSQPHIVFRPHNYNGNFSNVPSATDHAANGHFANDYSVLGHFPNGQNLLADVRPVDKEGTSSTMPGQGGVSEVDWSWVHQ